MFACLLCKQSRFDTTQESDRVFCSNACRQRAYRLRVKYKAGALRRNERVDLESLKAIARRSRSAALV